MSVYLLHLLQLVEDFYRGHAGAPGERGLSVWVDGAVRDQAGARDLLAIAASFLHDALPDFEDLLRARARAGARVRILLGDPDGDVMAMRGREEGIGSLLAERCKLSWRYFEPLLGEPGVLARQHNATLYTSLFRFDDTL